MQRKFKITFSDGHVGTMQILDLTTTPQAEVAKWAPEDQARIVKIEPVE